MNVFNKMEVIVQNQQESLNSKKRTNNITKRIQLGLWMDEILSVALQNIENAPILIGSLDTSFANVKKCVRGNFV